MRVMKSQCENTTEFDELGRFCLTPSQALTIFHTGEGQWHALAGEWLATLINLLQNIVMNSYIFITQNSALQSSLD